MTGPVETGPSGWIGLPPAGSNAASEGPVDVPALLRAGLAATATDADRHRLAVQGAVAAADTLSAAGLGPALLTRVAEAVRAAGIDEVAALPEPLPDRAQSLLLRGYLAAAAGEPAHVDRDRAFASWLGTVCVHLAIRRLATPG